MEVLIPSLKKKLRNYIVIALGALGLVGAGNAQGAQILDNIVVGPGLGDYEFESVSPNEFYYGKLFESTGYIDLLMLVGDSEPNGTSGSHPVFFYEEIYNETGIDWIDYHLELGYVVPDFDCQSDSEFCYDFLTISSELAFIPDALDNDAFDNANFMPEENPNMLWLDDGLVEDGDYFELEFAFNLPDFDELPLELIALYEGEEFCDGDCNEYVIALRQYPSISEVPVPAAVWLFGTALVGFIGISRRRKVS